MTENISAAEMRRRNLGLDVYCGPDTSSWPVIVPPSSELPEHRRPVRVSVPRCEHGVMNADGPRSFSACGSWTFKGVKPMGHRLKGRWILSKWTLASLSKATVNHISDRGDSTPSRWVKDKPWSGTSGRQTRVVGSPWTAPWMTSELQDDVLNQTTSLRFQALRRWGWKNPDGSRLPKVRRFKARGREILPSYAFGLHPDVTPGVALDDALSRWTRTSLNQKVADEEGGETELIEHMEATSATLVPPSPPSPKGYTEEELVTATVEFLMRHAGLTFDYNREVERVLARLAVNKAMRKFEEQDGGGDGNKNARLAKFIKQESGFDLTEKQVRLLREEQQRLDDSPWKF